METGLWHRLLLPTFYSARTTGDLRTSPKSERKRRCLGHPIPTGRGPGRSFSLRASCCGLSVVPLNLSAVPFCSWGTLRISPGRVRADDTADDMIHQDLLHQGRHQDLLTSPLHRLGRRVGLGRRCSASVVDLLIMESCLVSGHWIHSWAPRY